MTDSELAAKQLIQELVLKYCRAVDRKDYSSLSKLYHPDAIDDHGAMFSGSAVDFIQWLPTVLSTMQVTSHAVTNHLISIKGDRAEGEVYCTAYHLTHSGQEIIIGGRYLDKYVFGGEGWQFKHRKIVMDWQKINVIDDPSQAVDASAPLGSDIETDPSTSFFEFLSF